MPSLPKSLSGREKAYDFLREQVLTDPAMQGRFLNEQELAERIGVSRTPVREALLLLASEDLIEMIPQRGAQVLAMNGRQIAELMELRLVLEQRAAVVTMRQGIVPVQAMREALDRQEEIRDAGSDRDHQAFIEWDRVFHQVLVDAAGNELMARTYSRLRARQVLVGVQALLRRADRQERVCTEHEEIISELGSGDPQAAQRAIERHLAVTLDLLVRS